MDEKQSMGTMWYINISFPFYRSFLPMMGEIILPTMHLKHLLHVVPILVHTWASAEGHIVY